MEKSSKSYEVSVSDLIAVRCCLELGCDIFEAYTELCLDFDGDKYKMFRPEDALGKAILDELVRTYLALEKIVANAMRRNAKLAKILQYNLFQRFPVLRGLGRDDFINWKKKNTALSKELYFPITEVYSGESLVMRQIGMIERLIVNSGVYIMDSDNTKKLRCMVHAAISRARAYRILISEGGFCRYWLSIRKNQERTQLLINDYYVLANLNEGEPLMLLDILFGDDFKEKNEVKFNFKKYKTNSKYGRNAAKIFRESLKLDGLLYDMFCAGTSGNSVVFRKSVLRLELFDKNIDEELLMNLDLRLIQCGAKPQSVKIGE